MHIIIHDTIQFLQDWILAVVVLIMVVIDLVVLVGFTAVAGGLNLPLVERVAHRENPQTVEGVSISVNCLTAICISQCLCHFCRL